jgi:hypothetical protein
LEITRNYTSLAPEPVLRVAVLQSGRVVTDELNVNPGTTLQMELGLDQASAPIYGLLVSHMQVSDLRTQEETIIFNGSVLNIKKKYFLYGTGASASSQPLSDLSQKRST